MCRGKKVKYAYRIRAVGVFASSAFFVEKIREIYLLDGLYLLFYKLFMV